MYLYIIFLLLFSCTAQGMNSSPARNNDETVSVKLFQKNGDEVDIALKKSLLGWFKTLDKNSDDCDYATDQNYSPISSISPKTFLATLAIIENLDAEDLKKLNTPQDPIFALLKKQPNNRLAKLFNAADFLQCDQLLNACFEESYARIKNSRNIAYKMWYLNLLNPALSVKLGNVLTNESECIKKFNREEYSYTTVAVQEAHKKGPVLIATSQILDLVASGSGDNIIICDNNFNQKSVLHHPDGKSVRSLAFSPKNGVLAAGYDNGKIFYWDARSGELIDTMTISNPSAITALNFSPNGNQLVIGTQDGYTHLYMFVSGGVQRIVTHKSYSPIIAAKFSPNGRYLLIKYPERQGSSIWDLKQYICLKTFATLDVDFTPYTNKLITSEGLQLFDLQTNTSIVLEYPMWNEMPRFLAHSSQMNYVVAYYNKSLNIWNMVTRKCCATIKVEPVSSVAFSKNDLSLICGFYDGSMKAFTINEKALERDCRNCNAQHVLLLEQLLASGIKTRNHGNLPNVVEKNIKKLCTLDKPFFEKCFSFFKKPVSYLELPKSMYEELYSELPDKIIELMS